MLLLCQCLNSRQSTGPLIMNTIILKICHFHDFASFRLRRKLGYNSNKISHWSSARKSYWLFALFWLQCLTQNIVTVYIPFNYSIKFVFWSFIELFYRMTSINAFSHSCLITRKYSPFRAASILTWQIVCRSNDIINLLKSRGITIRSGTLTHQLH